MSRLVVAATAALLLAGTARAQEARPDDRKDAARAPAPPAPPPAAAGELDPKTRELVEREIERAKEDIRNEVRAEIQGAQSAAEFLGTVAEGPKLEFLQLDGYFRMRGQLFDDLSLGQPADPSGHYLFPRPLGRGGTLASANMRLRLEPTMNVSELVRVRAQIDVLDNYVLGSSTGPLFDDPYSPYPVPFYGATRVLGRDDPTTDRDAVLPKRVWGEVQTPVGLLSFGRMPSEWGLGILTNAGAGIDDDLGDTVDRLQFALPAVQTPLGAVTFVPILDFDAEGALRPAPQYGPGVGQPFDADSSDDARTYALKAARIDTEDEVRRKLDRGETSLNFGAYYNYRTQRNVFPAWRYEGFDLDLDASLATARRRTYGHVVDGWVRLLTPRWRVELETAGVFGTIGNAFTVSRSSATNAFAVQDLGRVLLRQWGGSLVTDFKAIPNKVLLGAELGMASGDRAPGFGNVPSRLTTSGARPPPGSLEGPQFGTDDRAIRNFRFNPAYRVDLILWRNVVGGVTDAWYLKPKIRWDIFPGLTLDGAIVYSMAMYSESTPSATAGGRPSKGLGIEGDAILTYTSGSGFQAFAEWGILQPLAGLRIAAADLSRAHALSFGLAARF